MQDLIYHCLYSDGTFNRATNIYRLFSSISRFDDMIKAENVYQREGPIADSM